MFEDEAEREKAVASIRALRGLLATLAMTEEE